MTADDDAPSSWCALLRGIGPGNPNMRNDRLREVFVDLGYADVGSVLSSGNIVCADPRERPDSDAPGGGTLGSPARAEAEARVQAALQETLGIDGGTVLRSRAELQALVDAVPFGGLEHSRSTYLTVTFLKSPSAVETGDLGEAPPACEPLGFHAPSAAVLTITDTTAAKTPDMMGWLERGLGKDITTRTWRTVERILAKMP